MKILLSTLIVSLLILTTGCSSHVSSGYGYDYGHHGHISVSGHGHNSGAAVVGALIVGGIIGTIIADSKNEQAKQQALQVSSSRDQSGTQEELVNGYSIDNSRHQAKSSDDDKTEYQTALANNQSDVRWYQYGKDGNCYLMGVDKGVTDVVSAVPNKKCEQ